MRTTAHLRIGDQPWVKWSLISLALSLVGLLLVVPLVAIFTQAFSGGLESYIANVTDRFTLHAIGLTLFVAALTVPINLVFGVFLAWLVTRFEFPGRKLLITLIDIPFAVSPVVAGLLYLLLYSSTCKGKVLVSPRIFPETTDTAPNSPTALALVNTTP